MNRSRSHSSHVRGGREDYQSHQRFSRSSTATNNDRGRGNHGGSGKYYFNGVESSDQYYSPESKASDRRARRRQEREERKRQNVLRNKRAAAMKRERSKERNVAYTEAESPAKKRSKVRKNDDTSRAREGGKRSRDGTESAKATISGPASKRAKQEKTDSKQSAASPPEAVMGKATINSANDTNFDSPLHPLHKFMMLTREKNAKLAKKRKEEEDKGQRQGKSTSAKSESSAIPSAVSDYVRRFMNKITLSNLVPLIREFMQYFESINSRLRAGEPSISRAVILDGLFAEVRSLIALAAAGNFSFQTSLSLAALLRALQLNYKVPFSAFVVQRLCELTTDVFNNRSMGGESMHERDEKTEERFARVVAVLGNLYLLNGVPNSVVVSLLSQMLKNPTSLSQSMSADDDDTTDAIILRATAGAVALLSVSAAKLRQEVPVGLEQALPDSGGGGGNAVASMLQSRTSMNRYQALLHNIREMVAGPRRHSRKAPASSTATAASVSKEGEANMEADVEAVISNLCELLPENTNPASHGDEGAVRNKKKAGGGKHGVNMKLLRQLVTSGSSSIPHTQITFADIVADEDAGGKPPQWWLPQSWDDFEAASGASKAAVRMAVTDAGESDQWDEEEEEEEEVESADEVDDPAPLTEEEEKRLAIERMRREEKVINSQHLVSEEKREIFKRIISATDDFECFQLLSLYYSTSQSDKGGGGTNKISSNNRSYLSFLQRVMEVALQCCLQEKKFNEYYFRLFSRFLSANSQNNRFAKMVQFVLWDIFKDIRLEGDSNGTVDIPRLINLSAFLCRVFSTKTSSGGPCFSLGLLRGLDLTDGVNKSIGLFTRLLILKLALFLPSQTLTRLFFGGDGQHALNASEFVTEDSELREALCIFVKKYFINEAEAKKWIPVFYDVVAIGTPFSNIPAGEEGGREDGEWESIQGLPDDEKLALFQKRIHVIYKALRHGIS